jgi:hypothetical protein
VLTVHTAGCGGLSDVHDLNGPEIRKWLKRDCAYTLLAAATAQPAADKPVTAEGKATFSVLRV